MSCCYPPGATWPAAFRWDSSFIAPHPRVLTVPDAPDILALALGDDLELMLKEVDNHIDHGLQTMQLMLDAIRQDRR